jgi:hypothetical protein
MWHGKCFIFGPIKEDKGGNVEMTTIIFSVIGFMVVFGLLFVAVYLSSRTSDQRRGGGDEGARLKACDLSVGCGNCSCDTDPDG